MRLPPFALERYFARHEFTARHLLCTSDCESLAVGELLAMEPGAEERLLAQRLGYTESAGSPALRGEIAGLYASASPQDVLVTAGAEEAVFLLMQAEIEPGDHVVVHWPCYQSLFEVARGAGCTVSRWEARESEGWSLDPDALRTLITPRTRMIVINSPHNPTGWQMGEGALREAALIAERQGIRLVSDEVYRGSEQRPEDRLPAAADLSPTAVSIGVLSKTYGLPGLRIGWIACRDAGLLSRAAALKDYTTICASAPSELLAETALRHGERIAERNRRIIAGNLALLDGFFARRRGLVEWVRPAAGPVGFPRLLQGDVEELCAELVARAGVLLLPGPLFGDAGGHFRIGFGRRSMPEALGALEAFLDGRPR
jgi:aspartate/methionine/tyrosine aminotransferase